MRDRPAGVPLLVFYALCYAMFMLCYAMLQRPWAQRIGARASKSIISGMFPVNGRVSRTGRPC